MVKGSPGDREETLRGIFNLGGRGKTFNIDTIGRSILVGITFIITYFTFGLFTLTIITYFLFTLILFLLVSLLLLTFLLALVLFTLVLLSGETTPEGPVTSGGVCLGKEEEANENY